MDNTLNLQIEALVYRFDHAITEADIVRWLMNFEEDYWSMAIKVLENVVYYSSDRIYATLKSYLDKILDAADGVPVIIVPVGSVGKSGYVMAYYAKKLVEAINDKSLVDQAPLSALNNHLSTKNLKQVVLLDDFSGTGESIKKFYNNKVLTSVEACKKAKYLALTVASMEDAVTLLQDECDIKLFGDIFPKTFAKNGSVFGGYDRMKHVREFCFVNGVKLFPEWQERELKPLGYKNSQALIAFEHTTPNNTIPILWFEDIIPGTDKKWNALFPRFANSRIDRCKRYRKEGYYWLARLKKQFKSMDNDINIPAKETMLLYNVLNILSRKRSNAYICQVLNISAGELDSVYEYGREHDVFTGDNKLTPKGKQIIDDIKKRELIFQTKENKKAATIENVTFLYIPKKFRGHA